MNSKVSSTLDKVRHERSRSNFKKALSRLDDAIKKFANELSLYTEGVELAMEAGESLKALQYIKTARGQFPDRRFEVWSFAIEKTRSYNDPIVGKFLIEHAVRSGDLTAAHSVAHSLKDHTADELLQRIRTKKQTLNSAFGGGMSVADDLMFNALSDALLCVRLSRFTEAMNGFLDILDENQRTPSQIEPFLAGLERDNRHNGELVYVLGCCYLISGQFDKAKKKISRALELSPSLRESAIQRVDSLDNNSAVSMDDHHMFLAGLLVGADDRRACELLSQLLDRSPNRALEVLEMLEPTVVTLGDDISLHYIYVDAAILSGRAETATGLLRKIYQVKKHRPDLSVWLDKRFRRQNCSVEILKFAGETALNEAMYGKAVEIFKEVLAHDPQLAPAIKELLARHRSNPLVDHFLRDRFNNAPIQARAAQHDFETYDRVDFAPAAHEEEVSESENDHDASLDRDFSSTEFSLGEDEQPAESGFDNRDFSLGMNTAATTDDDGNAITEEEEEEEVRQPLVEPETNTAGDNNDDSDFFDYIERDIPDEPSYFGGGGSSDEPADDDDLSLTPAPLDNQDILMEDTGPHDGGCIYQDDRGRNLELAEQALTTGHLSKARELLGFEPANLAEEFKRKYLLAEYYLAADRPIQALVILKAIHLPGLSRDERKDCMLRLAKCYQQLCNFEAAHSVFMRIIAEHPDSEMVGLMAKTNYEKYLQTINGESPVIEKVTSL
ncbi:MAG: hypothetical protein JSW50_07090 [Candidatus Latescibacterota bacterium]|nr:MAG: hypothetical protein JSW50_07090 [Candidatus Latescibacterota bacterium]